MRLNAPRGQYIGGDTIQITTTGSGVLDTEQTRRDLPWPRHSEPSTADDAVARSQRRYRDRHRLPGRGPQRDCAAVLGGIQNAKAVFDSLDQRVKDGAGR